MTDTEIETEVTEAGTETTPEKDAERQLIRSVGRALCRIEGAAGAEMKARWGEGRAKYTADARKLLRALGKEGVTLTAGDPPARGEAAVEMDAEDVSED